MDLFEEDDVFEVAEATGNDRSGKQGIVLVETGHTQEGTQERQPLHLSALGHGHWRGQPVREGGQKVQNGSFGLLLTGRSDLDLGQGGNHFEHACANGVIDRIVHGHVAANSVEQGFHYCEKTNVSLQTFFKMVFLY